MQIEIRQLGPDDAAEYRACRLDALKDSPSAFLSSYEEEQSRTVEMIRERFASQRKARDVVFFGAFESEPERKGERLAGIAGLVREEKIKRRHKMTVVSFFVRPEARKLGVGSKLMTELIDYARNVPGVEILELSVESTNTAAKALYSAFNFKTWGTEKAFSKIDGVYYDEDHMSLKL